MKEGYMLDEGWVLDYPRGFGKAPTPTTPSTLRASDGNVTFRTKPWRPSPYEKVEVLERRSTTAAERASLAYRDFVFPRRTLERVLVEVCQNYHRSPTKTWKKAGSKYLRFVYGR